MEARGSELRRKMADTIRSWRASRGEERLLIKGAQQVGKTYIVREVGQEDYKSSTEVNFIEQPAARQAFFVIPHTTSRETDP